MPIRIGANGNEPSRIYIGDRRITRAYRGSTLIWSEPVPLTAPSMLWFSGNRRSVLTGLSFFVEWAAVTGATGYEWRRRATSSASVGPNTFSGLRWSAWTATTSPYATIAVPASIGFRPTFMQVQVRSTRGTEASTPITGISPAADVALVAPVLTFTAGQPFRLTWTPVTGTLRYELQQYRNGAWTTLATPSPSATGRRYTSPVASAQPADRYRVRATRDPSGDVDDALSGPWSNVIQLRAPPMLTAPTLTGRFSPVSQGSSFGRVSLSWPAVSGASYYQLQEDVPGGGTVWSNVTGFGGPTASQRTNGVSTSRTYTSTFSAQVGGRYRVRATLNNGQSTTAPPGETDSGPWSDVYTVAA